MQPLAECEPTSVQIISITATLSSQIPSSVTEFDAATESPLIPDAASGGIMIINETIKCLIH